MAPLTMAPLTIALLTLTPTLTLTLTSTRYRHAGGLLQLQPLPRLRHWGAHGRAQLPGTRVT